MAEKEYHIDLAPGEVGRYVILPGDPGRTEKIAEFFDDPKEIAFKREYRTFTGTYKGVPVAVTSTGIGCPSTAIAVEELIKIGADTFIRVGTSGSLQEAVGVGDLAIATGAIREEGTTVQYVPLQYPAVAHPDVVFALRAAARKLDFKHHLGITHNKDAFYSEEEGYSAQEELNQLLWKTWMRANVTATSMEESALFILGSLRRVRTGSVLVVIGQTWAGKPVIPGIGPENAIKTALEAIKILDSEGK